MESPQTCPFCLSFDVRTIGTADDGLTSYRCHDCGRVFHSNPLRGSEAHGHGTDARPLSIERGTARRTD